MIGFVIYWQVETQVGAYNRSRDQPVLIIAELSCRIGFNSEEYDVIQSPFRRRQRLEYLLS